jgi:hypothetical protein
MRHPKLALLAALAALMALLSPAAAQAATHHGTHGTIHPDYATFTGYTYPDTALGLTACNADGQYILDNSGGNYQDWRCELNNPDAGLYGLYMVTYLCYPCGCKCIPAAIIHVGPLARGGVPRMYSHIRARP